MNEGKRDIQVVHTLALFATVFAMMTVGFFVLIFCARTIILSKDLLKQKIEIKATNSLENAGQDLLVLLNEKMIDIAKEQYDNVENSLTTPQAKSYSEEEAYNIYLQRMAWVLHNATSVSALDSELSLEDERRDRGRVSLDFSNPPTFSVRYDDTSGEIIGYSLKDVTFLYNYGDEYSKTRSFSYEFSVPKASFYDGNDSLFEYSLIGSKGIYITGDTSSVVGNLFGGTHSAEEYRRGEGGYGERGIYGGINILSTQVGVEAEKIISTGDINLRGAFVIFGTQDCPSRVYANDINSMNNFFARTDYTINGSRNPRNGQEYVNDVRMITEAGTNIEGFSYYYDSDNDKEYVGDYRKILSNTDVIISEDFTGVIMTSGNVIIEANCNVEGFVYSADRIYVQGNNNIVANRDILRKLLKEENEMATDSERFFVKDYLGGLHYHELELGESNYVKLSE